MLTPHLKAAFAAADAASAIIRKAYRGNFTVETKADASPVTEVDIAAEKAIRAVLSERFPAYGFYGEETGKSLADADYLWLVDPIDGTKAFVRGYPFFSVQIALMHRGELIMGLSSAPCYLGDGRQGTGAGELYYAERGFGAFEHTAEGPVPLKVSSVDSFAKATLSLGNIASLSASGAPWLRLGQDIIPKLHRIRGYADFVHYHLLASGRIDACVESNVNILDIAALAVIVREAGGRFTELDGGPLTLATTTVLASNGALHESLATTIGWRP